MTTFDGESSGTGDGSDEPARPSLSPAEFDQSRFYRLVEIIDYCVAAKARAEFIEDSFLVYLLSMAIQAARNELKPKSGSSSRE